MSVGPEAVDAGDGVVDAHAANPKTRIATPPGGREVRRPGCLTAGRVEPPPGADGDRDGIAVGCRAGDRRVNSPPESPHGVIRRASPRPSVHSVRIGVVTGRRRGGRGTAGATAAGVASTARGSSSNSHRAKFRRVHGLSPAIRTAARAPHSRRSTRWSSIDIRWSGTRPAAHRRRGTGPRAASGAMRPGGLDGLGGEDAALQRLGDALARHRVGGGGGVAHEQRPPGRRGPPGRSGPGWATPCGCRLRRGARARAPRATWGRASSSRPRALHVGHAAPVGAQDAEADVDLAAGQRERPGVAGQQVGLEPDPQPLGRRARSRRWRTAGRRATRRGSRARRRRAACAASTTSRRRRWRSGRAPRRGRRRRAPPGRRARWRRPGRGRRAPSRRRRGPRRRRAASSSLPSGARRRTDPRPRGTAARPPGRTASAPRWRRPSATTAPSPGRGRGPRAGAARRWSARRRSTCRGGTGPCRRAPRRGRRGPG